MKPKPKKLWMVLGIAGFILLILAGLTVVNLNFSRQNPGGNDFLVHWVGTRALLLDGISPYSDEAALQIQEMAYGRPARPGEHELRVAYPVYSVAVFFPFALVNDFNLARALWMTLLEAALLLLTYFSIRLVNWKPSLLSLAAFFVFGVLLYHSVRPLINGKAVILVALGLVGGLAALRARMDELAGILFALTTIKPQVVVLVVAWVLVWGVTQRRWRLVSWLVGTQVILIAVGFLLLPNWLLENLREVLRYPGYNPPGTLTAALASWFPSVGRRIGMVISGVLALVLLVEWNYGRSKPYNAFLWTFFLTLTISQWIGIQTDPGNFIVLLPALALVYATWEARWRNTGKTLTGVNLLILLVGIWWLFISTVSYGDQPQQSALLFLPLPAYLLVTLYWIRWWAVSPPATLYEPIAADDEELF